jgi:drug/metabolite transporter (DMT)-like permease
MDTKKKKLLADMALLFSAIIWGGDYIAAKIVLEEVSPLYMTAIRFSAAFIIMLVVFWKRVRRMTKKDLFAGLIVGFFMFGGFALQTIGLLYTTAGKSAFITSIYAVLVPLISWAIYKRFPGVHVMVGAVVCVAGVAVLSLNENLSMGIGDILTLGCAVFFAFNILSIAHYVKSLDAVVLTVVETGFSGLLAFILAVIFERPFGRQIGLRSTFSLIYLVILGTISTLLIANIALKHTSPEHGGIIFTTESAFAALFAFFILHERFPGPILIGCGLIFLAVIITEGGEMIVKGIQKRKR